MASPLRVLALSLLLAPSIASAQSGLEQMFDNLFNEFLVARLNLAPGEHANHFIPASVSAERVLVPALSSTIATNLASFPASSTQVGITFDFSSGQPIGRVSRLGPIFSETAGTVGRGHLFTGINVTYLSLNQLGGEDLGDLTFQFLHQDVGDEGVGDLPFERDVLIVQPNLDLNATIAALHATYGVTDRLDVGIAVPVVSLEARGTAMATIVTTEGTPTLHFFGGEVSDPVLTTEYDYGDSAVLIPNVTLRAKYNLLSSGFSVAALPELRLPVASEKSLLGSQDLGALFNLVGSHTFGRVNGQLNLGYEVRGGEAEPNRWAVTAGFDANVSSRMSIAAGLIGRIRASGDPIYFYDRTVQAGAPGSDTQFYTDVDGDAVEVPFSSVYSVEDAYWVGSLGTRFAFTERLQGIANVLVLLSSEQNLQSSLAPTVGITYSPF